MNLFLSTALLLLSFFDLSAQLKTKNVIIVTLDGMRWEEVFGGADSVLINDSAYVSDRKELKEKFWLSTPAERRQKLFPFIWKEVGAKGQVYGNRNLGNKVNNANRYWFSYPGYNEIFTGYPDTLMNTNDKVLNPNENVLEFLNKQPALKGKIAAFTSWDVFDYILNEKRSGIYVSSGFDKLTPAALNNTNLQLLNEMQMLSPQPLGDGVRPDFLTYFIAKNYLQKNKPRVLYISFDETDDYAHGGKYDYYLNAASMIDKWLSDLWSAVQAMPEYKDKTTLIITTDHGRGDAIKANWKHHGEKISDAGQIWIAAMGPDTKALGEVKENKTLFQEQIAATIAELMGTRFTTNHPVAKPIETIYTNK